MLSKEKKLVTPEREMGDRAHCPMLHNPSTQIGH